MPVGLQPILAVRLHSLANLGLRPHAFRGIRPCRFLILGSFDGLLGLHSSLIPPHPRVHEVVHRAINSVVEFIEHASRF